VGEVEVEGVDDHQPRERKLVMYNLRMRIACMPNKMNHYQGKTVPEINHGNESIPQSTNLPVEAASSAPAPATSSKVEEAKTNHQADWPMPDAIGNIGVGPSGFGHLTVQVDEDEDYDNED
jgi:hypothetical protein